MELDLPSARRASPDSVALNGQQGDEHHDLSRIPGNATVEHFAIFPRPMADWAC
jgi:hypothetical protein